MNTEKTGTYISIAIVILILTALIVNFGAFSLVLNRITGNFVQTSVFVYGPPNTMLRLWTKDLGNYDNGSLQLEWDWDSNISYYNLYITNNYSGGFQFSTPNKIFDNNTLTVTETDAADYSEIYYILRANNTYDLSEYNNRTWGKFTRLLYARGQNSNISLISIPLTPYNNSLYAFFIQNQSNYYATEVQKRNDITGSYELTFYLGQYGLDQWAGDFYTLEEGYGYWVKSTRDYNFTMPGQAKIENKTRPMYNASNIGNLFGYASVVPKSISDIAGNSLSDYNLTEVQKRKDNTGSFELVFYLGKYGINEWVGDFYDFEPGNGYWVKTAKDFNLTYGANER